MAVLGAGGVNVGGVVLSESVPPGANGTVLTLSVHTIDPAESMHVKYVPLVVVPVKLHPDAAEIVKAVSANAFETGFLIERVTAGVVPAATTFGLKDIVGGLAFVA